MKAGNPSLCAQVVQIDPHRGWRQVRHLLDEGIRNPAGKGFQHDPRWSHLRETAIPAANLDSLQALDRQRRIQVRAKQAKAIEVVDPQAHAQPVLGRQLPGDPPADPDIAEVVDGLAEDIPVGSGDSG